MSDTQNPNNDSSSLDGKGWDILVGGRDNPYEAGGKDPFDLDAAAKDAEADAVLGISTLPTPGAVVSPGVSVSSVPPASSPTSTSIIEIEPPGTGPVGVPSSPAGPSIVEIAPGGTSGPTPTSSAALPPIMDTGLPSPMVEFAPGPAASAAPLPPVPDFSAPVSAPPPPTMEPFGVAPVASGMHGIPPATSGGVPGFTIPYSAPSAMFGSGAPSFDDPFGGVVPTAPVSDATDLPVDSRLSKMLVTDERVNDLWDDINDTYKLVINDVRGHFNTTEQAIDNLRKARELLLHDVADFDNAEELVASVKARLRLEEKVRQWSVARGTWIAAYLLLWLILLSMASVFTNKFAEFAVKFVPVWMAGTWLPGLFGGLGGAVGALWILNKHITIKRDFDPIHTMWYVTNPFLGAALGVTTYVLVAGGGWLISGNGQFQLNDAVSLTLNALCLIVGFNPSVLWSIVDRFIKAIVRQKDKDEESAATDVNANLDELGSSAPASSQQGG